MKFYFLSLFCMLTAVASNFLYADAGPAARGNVFLSDYIARQTPRAVEKVLEAFVGAKGILEESDDQDARGLPGAIVAAPSVVLDIGRGEVQDYRWRWKRDAAISMRAKVRMMIEGELSHLPPAMKVKMVQYYVDFCKLEHKVHQVSDNQYELGHAKVTLDAKKNPHASGYPQNDGPPLEIYALVESINLLDSLKIEQPALRQTILELIKHNYEYILQHYSDPSVERWEEAKADSHFSVWLEMGDALRGVLKLSDRLSGVQKNILGEKLNEVQPVVNWLSYYLKTKHVSPEGFILAHNNLHLQSSLAGSKESALDTQVLMSSLATNKYWDNPEDLFFPPSHPAMRATFQKLRQAFNKKYPTHEIGRDQATSEPLRGLVFGRYPEDKSHFSGNPWFITSFAAVQFLLWDALYVTDHGVIQIHANDFDYFMALNVANKELLEKRKFESWPLWIDKTDPIFLPLRNGLVRLAKESFYRLAVHAGDGRLTEIFDGVSGEKEGIEDLTWSYVEFLKTARLLRRAQNQFAIPLDIQLPKHSCEVLLANKRE